MHFHHHLQAIHKNFGSRLVLISHHVSIKLCKTVGMILERDQCIVLQLVVTTGVWIWSDVAALWINAIHTCLKNGNTHRNSPTLWMKFRYLTSTFCFFSFGTGPALARFLPFSLVRSGSKEGDSSLSDSIALSYFTVSGAFSDCMLILSRVRKNFTSTFREGGCGRLLPVCS